MRRRRLPGPLAAVLLLLAGCGVPSDGAVSTVDPTRIPAALASPAPSAPSSPVHGTAPGPVRVFLLDTDLLLTGRPLADVPAGTPDAVGTVLRRLREGPSEGDRAAGLQSALGADVRLSAAEPVDGVVTLQVSGLSEDQSADRLPLAVGQVVLSLTSVPGVDGARLQRDGVDREVPLPGGALTARVLTAADYAPLLAPPGETP